MIKHIQLHGGPFHGLYSAAWFKPTETTITLFLATPPDNPNLPDQHVEIRRGHYERKEVSFGTAHFNWKGFTP